MENIAFKFIKNSKFCDNKAISSEDSINSEKSNSSVNSNYSENLIVKDYITTKTAEKLLFNYSESLFLKRKKKK